jgi:AcrR family transcriptional regulator
MPRPRTAAFANHRELILLRSAELFANRGYLGTSMNEVAEACGMSKPTLYHYYRDKEELLTSITDRHVSMLVEQVAAVENAFPPGEARLKALIERFLHAYAGARNEHRVLTEDVRFLSSDKRRRILDKERRVVDAFASSISATRPDLGRSDLSKPLAMLLFGMLNWMFTWLRQDGRLTHSSITPIVVALFFGGLHAIPPPEEGKTAPSAAKPSPEKASPKARGTRALRAAE